ncbi:hypothetical protein OK016_17045 [Vibrio chagasii]|nr:hypothetical protein [Vibrio chagasii]
MADFAETLTSQRTYELGKTIRSMGGVLGHHKWKTGQFYHPKNRCCISWFGGYVKDSISQTLNVKIREFLEALTSLVVVAPETSQTRMQHHLLNDSQTWKGKSSYTSPIHRGNLWVNESA